VGRPHLAPRSRSKLVRLITEKVAEELAIMDQGKPQILGHGRARRRAAAYLISRPEMLHGSLMVYGQVGENLILIVGRVASLRHHGGDQRPRRRYCFGGRVNEPLLDGCPLIRITLPRDTGQWTDVKSTGPPLALGELSFRRALAAVLGYQTVVFRTEAPPQPAAAPRRQQAAQQGTDHDDGNQGDDQSGA
jgi:hypothetical protein